MENDAPVFILAAGWRSGSTLLQRMCMEEYFMWGEPYGTSGTIPAMCDAFARSIAADSGEKMIYKGGESPEFIDKFIANLSPDFKTLVDAHRAFFKAMFARQEKWGLKEVRLDANHATYLRYLFPKAKIVFLYRNPYDCWRSVYKWLHVTDEGAANKLYDCFPGAEITEQNFGKHWAFLTKGFLEKAKELNACVISYEDLCAGKWERLEKYLGFKLSKKAFETNPRDGFGGRAHNVDLSIIRKQVDPLAASLGYYHAKFELTKESRVVLGHRLYRIKALVDFGDVKAGDLGGFVQSEKNLHSSIEEDKCDAWVYDNACLFEGAVAFGNTKIKDDAMVFGQAIVTNSTIDKMAWVHGNASVINGIVTGNADISGHVEVCKNGRVDSETKLLGNERIAGYGVAA